MRTRACADSVTQLIWKARSDRSQRKSADHSSSSGIQLQAKYVDDAIRDVGGFI